MEQKIENVRAGMPDLLERLPDLLEREKLFLYDAALLRQVLDLPPDGAIREKFGLPLNRLMDVYRIDHARKLLVEYKIKYDRVWRLSGFGSEEELENAMEEVVEYKKNH